MLLSVGWLGGSSWCWFRLHQLNDTQLVACAMPKRSLQQILSEFPLPRPKFHKRLDNTATPRDLTVDLPASSEEWDALERELFGNPGSEAGTVAGTMTGGVPSGTLAGSRTGGPPSGTLAGTRMGGPGGLWNLVDGGGGGGRGGGGGDGSDPQGAANGLPRERNIFVCKSISVVDFKHCSMHGSHNDLRIFTGDELGSVYH